MEKSLYLQLLGYARRQTRAAGEDADLLQSALLAAVEAGRFDMARAENRNWLRGVIRNRALHEARSAARRRNREGNYAHCPIRERNSSTPEPFWLEEELSPTLRTTALLVMTGHSKAEICWLLSLSDMTLRKRISELGRRLRNAGASAGAGVSSLRGDLYFGLLRQALLKAVRLTKPALGTHDPDGHLLVLTSQKMDVRQLRASGKSKGDHNVR